MSMLASYFIVRDRVDEKRSRGTNGKSLSNSLTVRSPRMSLCFGSGYRLQSPTPRLYEVPAMALWHSHIAGKHRACGPQYNE